jgi:hypothetical protein
LDAQAPENGLAFGRLGSLAQLRKITPAEKEARMLSGLGRYKGWRATGPGPSRGVAECEGGADEA